MSAPIANSIPVEMPRKKQGLRSYHQKSKNGCSNCKKRRVKCNMQGPVCANCARRNELCEYQTLDGSEATQWSMTTPEPWNAFEAIAPPPHPPHAGSSSSTSYAPPEYWLATHVGPASGTIETTLTFESPLIPNLQAIFTNSWFTPLEKSLWIPAIEKSALKYPYVMHSIYSIAALIQELHHGATNEENRMQTPVTAYQHYITASTLFRQAPPEVNEDNWVAILTFGIIMIVFQFSVQQACSDEDFDLIQTIRVLRTSKGMNQTALPFLERSPFWPLIQRRVQQCPQPMDVKLRAALQQLARIVSQSIENHEPSADVNRQAYCALREWAFACEGCPRTWTAYFKWPHAVTEEYFGLLSEGDDIALLIIIHWCLIMHQSPWRRFVTTWSKRAASHAMSTLRADWGDVLAWPMEVLELSPSVLAPGVQERLPPIDPALLEMSDLPDRTL